MYLYVFIFFIFILSSSGLLIIRKNLLNRVVILNLITSFVVCIICIFSFIKNTTNYIDISFFYILLGVSVPLALLVYYKKT